MTRPTPLRAMLGSTALALLLALAPTPGAAQDAAADLQAARQAATAWLQTLDAQRYADTWVDAAMLFKNAVPQARWEAAVQSAREPLGALQSRTESSAKASTSLPGVPDGQYVVLTYDSRFANKERATETVATVRESAGHWKVAGYFVR